MLASWAKRGRSGDGIAENDSCGKRRQQKAKPRRHRSASKSTKTETSLLLVVVFIDQKPVLSAKQTEESEKVRRDYLSGKMPKPDLAHQKLSNSALCQFRNRLEIAFLKNAVAFKADKLQHQTLGDLAYQCGNLDEEDWTRRKRVATVELG